MIRYLAPVVVLVCLLAAVPVKADICAVDQRPGATLLIPWFSVDLENASGTTTSFWVRNLATSPTLTNVTLWSDYGVPAFWFNVYLPAFGTERIDLGALLREGRMPRTGAGVSGLGSFDLAGSPANFPACHGGTTVGIPPVYANLSAAQYTEFGKRLSGQQAQDGACYASDYGDNVARGYVTVDTVFSCGTITANDPGYFISGGNGTATNDNVLLGGFEIVDPSNNFASASAALVLEAQTGGFFPGDVTFYTRKVDFLAVDEREPLPFSWSFDFDGVSNDGSADLAVWRSVPRTSPRQCGTVPPWYPYNHTERTPFDRDGGTPLVDPFYLGGTTYITLATQLFPTGLIDESLLEPSPPAGSGRINLATTAAGDFQPEGQSWIGVLHSSEGRFSELQPARALDSGCAAGLMVPAATSGPVQFNPAHPDYIFLDGFSS
jgi:hypothetical protein